MLCDDTVLSYMRRKRNVNSLIWKHTSPLTSTSKHGGGHSHESTSTRLRFDRRSIPVWLQYDRTRPFHDLRYDRVINK